MLEVLNLQILLSFFVALIVVTVVCWYLEFSIKTSYIVIVVCVSLFIVFKIAFYIFALR